MQDLFDRIREQIAAGSTAALAESLRLPERRVSFALGSLTPALLVCLTERRNTREILYPEKTVSYEAWANEILSEKKIPVLHAIAAFSGLSPVNVEAILPVAAKILAHSLHEMDMKETEQGGSPGVLREKQKHHALRLLPAMVVAQLISFPPSVEADTESLRGSWSNALVWLLSLFLLLLLLASACNFPPS